MENKIVIGKIIVPKNAIPDFMKQYAISRDLLKTVSGFVKQEFFEQFNESGDLTFVGATTWEDEQAFKAGGAATQEEYKRINFNQAEFYQRMHIKGERAVYTRSETITGSASLSSENAAVIDQFFVPKDAIAAFKDRGASIMNSLKQLNGFVQTEVFERFDEGGNLVMYTITSWSNKECLEAAKKAMMNKSTETGFNPAEFYAQTGITLDRGIYSVLNN